MKHHDELKTFRLEGSVTLAQAQPWSTAPVTLDSPALEVVTDLTRVKAATVHPDTPLRQAEQMMIYQGVRMLFVVTHMPHVEGLVTSTDLQGERPMSIVHERQLHYDELCVRDVMTDWSALDAIDHARLSAASVGSLIATLARVGRHHLLVVQNATDRTLRCVRGIVSRAQIERQLGSAIDVMPIASSFAEIERVLA